MKSDKISKQIHFLCVTWTECRPTSLECLVSGPEGSLNITQRNTHAEACIESQKGRRGAMLTIQRTLIELCATSSLEGKVRVHVLVSCPLSFFDASESPAN